MNITSTGFSDFNYVEVVNLSDFSHTISEKTIRLTNANKYKTLKKLR